MISRGLRRTPIQRDLDADGFLVVHARRKRPAVAMVARNEIQDEIPLLTIHKRLGQGLEKGEAEQLVASPLGIPRAPPSALARGAVMRGHRRFRKQALGAQRLERTAAMHPLLKPRVRLAGIVPFARTLE